MSESFREQHGIVLADKPRGLGSTPLVSRLRGHLLDRARAAGHAPKKGGRKIRVGHTGTLDRFASGLMILVVGHGTAFADHFLHQDKSYLADFAFGRFTDTHDPQGEVLEEKSPEEARRFLEQNRARVEEAVGAFREMTLQIPPVYSALKKDGQRFSDRARRGDVESPAPRKITIHSSEIREWDGAGAVVRAEIAVSSGTYIRALARDLSETLGFPLHLSDLRRLNIGSHRLNDDCWSPREGEDSPPEPVITSLEQALGDWPRLEARAEDVPRIKNGIQLEYNRLKPSPGFKPDAEALVTEPGGRILAWAEKRRAGDGRIRYRRVFSD